jgi:acylphosphatase
MISVKKYLLFFIALTLFTFSFAEKISIKEARSKDILSTVTVEGYVTLEPGLFANNSFFIEKDGYGVNIYTQGKDISELNIERNDLIEVTGYTWNHKSNLEVVLETDNKKHEIKILQKNAKKIEPREINVEDIKDEELEGSLVHLDAKIIKNMGQEIIIGDETGEGILWIRENTDIIPDYLKEGLDIEITGILAQYLSSILFHYR